LDEGFRRVAEGLKAEVEKKIAEDAGGGEVADEEEV